MCPATDPRRAAAHSARAYEYKERVGLREGGLREVSEVRLSDSFQSMNFLLVDFRGINQSKFID